MDSAPLSSANRKPQAAFMESSRSQKPEISVALKAREEVPGSIRQLSSHLPR
jgi:hypothetical protein